jgi:hypothetical protein
LVIATNVLNAVSYRLGRIRSFLLAWQWHNPNSRDAVGALVLAAQRMGGAITEAEAEIIIEEAATTPKCRKADVLAKFLHLSDKMRSELQIRTIGSVDVSKQQRAIWHSSLLPD